MNHFCWERECAYTVSLCVLLLQNQMCLSSLYAHKWCSCLFITPLLISAVGWLDLPVPSLLSLCSSSTVEAQFCIVQLFRRINSLSIVEMCLGSSSKLENNFRWTLLPHLGIVLFALNLLVPGPSLALHYAAEQNNVTAPLWHCINYWSLQKS